MIMENKMEITWKLLFRDSKNLGHSEYRYVLKLTPRSPSRRKSVVRYGVGPLIWQLHGASSTQIIGL